MRSRAARISASTSPPRTLTKEQKTLYQKLHAASGIPEQAEDDRGVFDRIKDAFI